MTHEEILEKINELYTLLRDQMLHDWKRDLPFEELLFDRWQRAKNLNFSENSSIYHNSFVYGDVKVGKNSWIGPYTLLDGTGGLRIGDWCCISAQVQIYTHDTVKRFVSGGLEPSEYSPVNVEDNCYIGPGTVISKGVTIGNHSVIGSSSFVNKDIPAFSIAFGSPAKVVGQVVQDHEGKFRFSYESQ